MTNDTFSIFDQVRTERTWAKFNVVGDAYEGTYINREDGIKNTYGNDQTLVELLQKDGTVITVAIGDTKTILLEQLANCDYGQIIGFKFTASKEQPGRNPSKIIKLVADKQYVNKAWLVEHEAKQAQLAAQLGSSLTPANNLAIEQFAKLDPADQFTTAPAPVAENAPAAPVEANDLRQITNLAAVKFGTVDLNELKNKIMETTGLALIPSNFSLILQRLQ